MLAVVAFVAPVAAGATTAAASPAGTSGVLADDATANETTVDVGFVGTVTDQGTVTVEASGVTDNGTPVDGIEATVTVGGEVATTATVTNGELSAEFDPGVLELAPTDSAEVGLQGYTVGDPATVEVVHKAFELNASTRLRSVPQGVELAAENVTAVTVWDAAAGTYDSVTSPDFETAADFHQGLYVSIGGSDARVGYTFDTTASEAGTVDLSTGWNFASSNFNISQTENLTVEEDFDLISGNVSDLDIFTADFSQQLAPNDTAESFDGYWVFVEDGDQPVERNTVDPAYVREAREDVLGIAESSVSFTDQATTSSTFTGANQSTPGVVVEAEADVESAVVVTYQNGSDLVIAGLDSFTESELDGSGVAVPVTEFGGFPGSHTAHVIPVDDLSGSYAPGDTVSSATADVILDNEQATVFQGTVEFANQTAPDGIAGNDTLATLDTADLLDGATNDTAFTVDVHPTDENGALVGAGFVGSSDVLTGANDNVTVTAERVPDNGEFNEFPLTRNDSYVAMIHLVDDSASAGDPAAPGQYPALRHASENGTVPGGVTDQGRIAFPAGSIINGTVTASGDTVNTDQAAGEPVSGANVTLYSGNSTDPADEVANTTTSQNGEYAFMRLSTDNYTVELSDEEFVTESALLAVGVNETVTEEFAPDYAEAGNLSGEIGLDAVDPDEAVNLTVTMVGTGNSTTVSLAGSENATTYTIPDVDVNVGDGYTVSATSDSGNYTDPADAENVTVNVGATTTGVDFGFTRRTGDLDGTVTNGVGSAIEGATVEVFEFGSDGPLVANDTTDTSGAYSIPDLPVGDHFVTVSVDGAAAGETNATILSNQTTSANFTLDAANFTVATDGDLVGVAGETQTATVTVENIGDLPGEQTVELDWGNGTYTNSTSVVLDGGSNITITNTTTENNVYGVRVQSDSKNVTLTDSTVGSNTDTGIQVRGSSEIVRIRNTTIENNPDGVRVGSVVLASTVEINRNNIVGNNNGVVNDNSTGTVNATENWWGDESGPSGEGTGTGDSISTNVAFGPWFDAPVPGGEPVSVVTGTVSTNAPISGATVEAIAGNGSVLASNTTNTNGEYPLDSNASTVNRVSVSVEGTVNVGGNPLYAGSTRDVTGSGSVTGLDFNFSNTPDETPTVDGITISVLYGTQNGDASATPIANVEMLQMITEDLSGDYELVRDIDTSATSSWNGGDGFEPIGTSGNEFKGTFDGYTILNLTVNRTLNDDQGLFGNTSTGATIENVDLAEADLTGGEALGALVGWNEGTLTGATVTGNLTQDTDNSDDCGVGGLVGYNNGTVNDSTADVSVSGGEWRVGGLVGYSTSNGTIRNSSATGTITQNDDATFSLGDAGGLIGFNRGLVADSYATGNVESKTKNKFGGLAGRNDGTIRDSNATGDVTVTGDATEVGDLVGYNGEDAPGSINNSFVTGDVSTQDDNVGGLVGYAVGTVNNSYALGNITGSGNSGTAGLVGKLEDKHGEGVVKNSYAVGSVSGSSDVGGAIGNNVSGSTSNVYWDTESTGQSSSDSGTGLTTSEMTGTSAETNMTALDFVDVWETVPGDCPTLRVLSN